MQFRYARNLKVKDLEVTWEKPDWANWKSSLYFEDVEGLKLQGFSGGPAKPQTEMPAVVLDKVNGAMIRDAAPKTGTEVFVKVKGASSAKITITGSELHDVKTPFQVDSDVKPDAVRETNNF